MKYISDCKIMNIIKALILSAIVSLPQITCNFGTINQPRLDLVLCSMEDSCYNHLYFDNLESESLHVLCTPIKLLQITYRNTTLHRFFHCRRLKGFPNPANSTCFTAWIVFVGNPILG